MQNLLWCEVMGQLHVISANYLHSAFEILELRSDFIMDTDRDRYSRLGRQLNELHSSQLSTQLSVFESALVNFANDHGDEIQQNNEFRTKFNQMCQLIGIDPLELTIYSHCKTPARDQNFYISLAVKVVEVCQETRNLNGGLISFKELLPRLQKNVNLHAPINQTDLVKCLDVLQTLGNGYEILTINEKKWLKFSLASSSSLNDNFTNDQKRIYEVCTFMGGYVTYRLLRDNYGWDKIRCKSVIDEMITNGFLWVDSQGGSNGEWQYWEPSWISS